MSSTASAANTTPVKYEFKGSLRRVRIDGDPPRFNQLRKRIARSFPEHADLFLKGVLELTTVDEEGAEITITNNEELQAACDVAQESGHVLRLSISKLLDTQPSVPVIEHHTDANDDGNGNTVYLDRHHVKAGPSHVLTGFHLTRPTQATIQYQFWSSPTKQSTDEPATEAKSNTPANKDGEGKVIYLDRHVVMAPGSGLLTGFKLHRTDSSHYQYQFSFNPVAGVGPVLEQATAPQLGENAHYLDRQTIQAPPGYGLKGFRLIRPTKDTIAYKYWVQKIA